MEFLLMMLIYLFGVCGGAVAAYVWFNRREKMIGTIRIDSSDPDGPYLFLELEQSVDYLKTRDTVLMKVSTESYISQK